MGGRETGRRHAAPPTSLPPRFSASHARIASTFRVRRQRVAAILALRELEQKAENEGRPLNVAARLMFEGGADPAGAVRAALDASRARVAAIDAKGGPNPTAAAEGGEGEEASADGAAPPPVDGDAPPPATPSTPDLIQGVWPCDRMRGTGEAPVARLPRFPAFEIRPASASAPPAADEATPAESDVPAREAALAAAAEATAAKEFEARVAANAAAVAAAAAGAPRAPAGERAAPRRPAAGWSLVVTPLGGPRSAKPYVSEPGGETRALRPAEAAVVAARRPKPRRRIL